MTPASQRFLLAVLVILIGAGIALALIFINIPDRNESILNIGLGLILGWGGMALGWYFGSSEGSDRKTELMHRGPTGEPGDPVHVEPDEPL